ncbi:MAG: ergothioneine biosynthesis protein EgtB [Bryobacteraceae bacterium]
MRPSDLASAYSTTRRATENLCAALETEDYVVQPIPDASPPKWHLAHTSWFFERVVLSTAPGYREFHPHFSLLFNSYYHSFGPRWARNQRGALSRPTVREVLDYRRWVDRHMADRLASPGDAAPLIELGIHHEQQHQELLVADIKAILGNCPTYPAYHTAQPPGAAATVNSFTAFAGGRHEIGFGGDGFAYDNESPSHAVWLEDFEIADRLVSNREFLEFIDDGGYRQPALWLSDGFDTARAQGWDCPLYWIAGEARVFTMAGLQPLDLDQPVCHVSYFEAEAFARWKGLRLPTEAEWEVAAVSLPRDAILQGSFLESGVFQPQAARGPGLREMFGELWQWTTSAYLPYPGFVPLAGALGEYNGKFMNGQYVLRGGSCGTPRSHIRATYRNFFSPEKRWQYTGIRLAR